MAKKSAKGITMCLVLLCLLCNSFFVEAENYLSYTYDAYGEEVPVPPAYMATNVYVDIPYEGKTLNSPEDCCTGPDGKLYICDTGNNRIVVLNKDFSLHRVINEIEVDGEKPHTLNGPKGIYVSPKETVYICDTGNARILVTDKDFKQCQAPLLRPQSSLIPEKTAFVPNKVTADDTGNVYVVAHGIYQGLISYDVTGEFVGFFGGNPVELTWSQSMTLFWKELFSDVQKDAVQQFIPIEFTNLFIGEKNCIYTVTQKTNSSKDEIKKLNAMGNNVMRYDQENTLYAANDFGDHNSVISGPTSDTAFADIHVDEDGIISALDIQRGRVFQYDQDGNLLFVFGGIQQQDGMFTEPSAVDKMGDDYIVLDRVFGSITVFEATDYAKSVRNALLAYSAGEYGKAQEIWQDVLDVSNYSSLAYRGIGRSLLQQQKYKEAMDYLRKAEDRIAYSEAFNEVRKDYLRQYLGLIVVIVVAGFFVISKLLRFVLVRIGVLEPKKSGGGGR